MSSLWLALLVVATPPPNTSPAPEPAAAAAPTKAPPRKPYRPTQQGMPAEVVPATIYFESAAHANAFLRLDVAARKIAQPDWYELTGQAYPYLSWNAGSNGYLQNYSGHWEQFAPAARNKPPTRPNHTIALSTDIYNTGRKAYGYRLQATKSTASGWRANIDFSTHDGLNGLWETLRIVLDHPQLAPQVDHDWSKPERELRLGVGQCFFQADRREPDFAYQFRVGSAPPDERVPNRSLRKEVAAYWKSPESFRAAALAELDRWEANMRKQLADGSTTTVLAMSGVTSANPPQPVPNAVVPPKMQAEVLEQALTNVAAQRKLVEGHFEDLHAIVVASFPPFAEIVAGKE